MTRQWLIWTRIFRAGRGRGDDAALICSCSDWPLSDRPTDYSWWTLLLWPVRLTVWKLSPTENVITCMFCFAVEDVSLINISAIVCGFSFNYLIVRQITSLNQLYDQFIESLQARIRKIQNIAIPVERRSKGGEEATLEDHFVSATGQFVVPLIKIN